MKKLYLLLFTFLPAIIFAQSNYHAGYVVKNTGDTVKGYINYREWDVSPTSIEFKTNKTDKNVIQFSTADTKAFQITGLETYIYYKGLLSMDKTRFPELPDHFDTTRKVQTVFLRQLATGKYLTLYYLNDYLKTRYFIAETGKEPVELKNYSYYNDDKEVIYVPVYKRQLVYEIGKFYPEGNKLVNKVEFVKYEQSDLESLINQINNTHNTAKRNSSYRFFVGAAANITQTNFDNINYLSHPESSSTVTPKINVGVDLFGNPDVQKFVFRGELSFTYINPHYTSSESQSYPVVLNTNADYGFTQYSVGLSPQLLYNIYNADNLKVYLDAGPTVNFSTYTNNRLILKKSGAVENNTTTTNKPYTLNSVWNSFFVQTGVAVNKKLEFSVTYMTTARYSNQGKGTSAAAFKAENQSINLGVRFLMGHY